MVHYSTKHSSTAHAVIMRGILYKILHTYDTLHYLTILYSERHSTLVTLSQPLYSVVTGF